MPSYLFLSTSECIAALTALLTLLTVIVYAYQSCWLRKSVTTTVNAQRGRLVVTGASIEHGKIHWRIENIGTVSAILRYVECSAIQHCVSDGLPSAPKIKKSQLDMLIYVNAGEALQTMDKDNMIDALDIPESDHRIVVRGSLVYDSVMGGFYVHQFALMNTHKGSDRFGAYPQHKAEDKKFA